MNQHVLPLVAVSFTAFFPPSLSMAQSFGNQLGNNNQTPNNAVIVSGQNNAIGRNANSSFIGAGRSNSIPARVQFATIGGGVGNTAGGAQAVVGGGLRNTAQGQNSFIGGGRDNNILTNNEVDGGSPAIHAVIAGGAQNTNTGLHAFIGGGFNNEVTRINASVVGGLNNDAKGNAASVGGGSENQALGDLSTVPGGVRGKATHNNSFVWGSENVFDTESFGDKTFTVRCAGGARFYTTANSTNVGPRLAAGGTDWVQNSDSNLKTKVTAIDPRDILLKLSRLPVTEWEYKHNPDRRYIGPTAQDFHATFGLGDDDKGIGTLDSDGVMYAAIKGLVEELKERDKAMAARDRTIEELKSELRALREEVRSGLPPAP